VKVLGPVPAPISRAEGKYRMHILLKAGTHKPLLELAKKARSGVIQPDQVTLIFDMNPMSLM
jgi:primosomal protein N'